MKVILVKALCLFLDDGHFGYIKKFHFISLCILRDLPQQKITKELCSGGDRTIFLCSHVLTEQFLMGRIRKFKNTRRKGTNQENSIKQEGNNGGKKEKRSLHMWGFPYWCVCHWLGMPRAVRPSVRRTHSYGNPPYNITNWKKKHAPPVLLINPCIQVIIQVIVSSVRSNYRKQLSYYL
jgi:hypothetical protein